MRLFLITALALLQSCEVNEVTNQFFTDSPASEELAPIEIIGDSPGFEVAEDRPLELPELFFNVADGVARSKAVVVGVGEIRSAADPSKCLTASYKGTAKPNTDFFRMGLYTSGEYFVTRVVNGVSLRTCPSKRLNQRDRPLTRDTSGVVSRSFRSVNAESIFEYDEDWSINRVFVPEITLATEEQFGGEVLARNTVGFVAGIGELILPDATVYSRGATWTLTDDGVVTSRILSVGNVRVQGPRFAIGRRTIGPDDYVNGMPISTTEQIAKNFEDGKASSMCLQADGTTHALCNEGEKLQRWAFTREGEVRKANLDGSVTNQCLTSQGAQVLTTLCDGRSEQRWLPPILPAQPIVSGAFTSGGADERGCLFLNAREVLVVTRCNPQDNNARLNFLLDGQGGLRPATDLGSCILPAASVLDFINVNPDLLKHRLTLAPCRDSEGWRVSPTGQLFYSRLSEDGVTQCLSIDPPTDHGLATTNSPYLVSIRDCDVTLDYQRWSISDVPDVSLASFDTLAGKTELAETVLKIEVEADLAREISEPVQAAYRRCVNNRTAQSTHFCLENGSDFRLTTEGKLQSELTGQCLSVPPEYNFLSDPDVVPNLPQLRQELGSLLAGGGSDYRIPLGMGDCAQANSWKYTGKAELRGTGFLSGYCIESRRASILLNLTRCGSQRQDASQVFHLIPSTPADSARAHGYQRKKVVNICGNRPDKTCRVAPSFASFGLSVVDLMPDGTIMIGSGAARGRYLLANTSRITFTSSLEDATKWVIGLDGSIRSLEVGREVRNITNSAFHGPMCMNAAEDGTLEMGRCDGVANEFEFAYVSGGDFVGRFRKDNGVALVQELRDGTRTASTDPLAVLTFAKHLGLDPYASGLLQGMSSLQRQQFNLFYTGRITDELPTKENLDSALERHSPLNPNSNNPNGLAFGAVTRSSTESFNPQDLANIPAPEALSVTEELIIVDGSASSSLGFKPPNGFFGAAEANGELKVNLLSLNSPLGELTVESGGEASAEVNIATYDVGGVPVYVLEGTVKAEAAVLTATLEKENAELKGAIAQAETEAGVDRGSAAAVAGASVVSGSAKIGSDTGNQVGVGGGVGVGAGGKIAFGKDGRFGFTGDVKFVTVDFYFDPKETIRDPVAAAKVFYPKMAVLELAINEFEFTRALYQTSLAFTENALSDVSGPLREASADLRDKAEDLLDAISNYSLGSIF